MSKFSISTFRPLMNENKHGAPADYRPKVGTGNCAAVAARLWTRGTDGKLKSVITGRESDAELQGIAVWFMENCSASRQNPQCPFSILKKAYPSSLNSLLKGMTRAAILSLIELEVEARNNHPALCGEEGPPALAVHLDSTP
jgi:hypothetical protein